MSVSIFGSGIISKGDTEIKISDGALILPAGNNATRVNVLGALRFNNQSNIFEAYDGAQWSRVSAPAPLFANVLIVAGGGAGGSPAPNGARGGGGGAGGLLEFTDLLIVNKSIEVSIGAGGSTPGGVSASSSPGSDSKFDIYTVTGGGNGGGGGPTGLDAGSGGSGGGAGTPAKAEGAAGNTPPKNPPQGNPGGGSSAAGGGGGGAGGAGGVGGGAPAPTAASGAGGNGYVSNITGSSVSYAGGGFGLGRSSDVPLVVEGQTNRGGGGGGGRNGGSGMIVFRYPTSFSISNPDNGLTYTTDSSNVAGYNITTFTAGTGIIQWS